ncbi:hypothetical protein SAMN02746041_00047 [Desulfacinum hydrothermale DSM 13146]|uniref:HesB-like selenoprotein n=2 Tax=Desulfacinum hydrothermale TaxID=109258 RepID=A0A1W1WX36_9BACT|nr:hypothetical protein [Desulfacinum hydrothermale]SMC16306.1 hypothetical protein SAMN02746041_00047 [Desulfacinum hydrothermale DSM 13146]
MVLDEPTEADEIFKVNGFTMVVNKSLLDLTKSLTVDFVDQGVVSGFRVLSEVPIGGGGGCGTSCSC